MQFRIRNATSQDVDLAVDFFNKLQKYHQELNPAMWTLNPDANETFRKHFLKELKSEAHFARLAFDSNDIVAGILLAEIQQNIPIVKPSQFGYITDLFVDQNYRRQGLAEQLLEDISKIFRAHNISEIRLQVDAKNLQGLSFYQKHDFEIITHKMQLKL